MTDLQLQTLLVLTAAAVIAVPIAQRLKFGAVIGYLVAGVAVGPWGASLVTDVKEIAHLGELGVVFLLFLIGLELKPARLWLMRHDVFGLGGSQVAVTALVIGAAAYLGGFGLEAAAVVGLALSLSSTAMVLQLLSERRALNTRSGRTSFAVLLFQDVAAVPMLALVAVLSVGREMAAVDFGTAALEAVAIIAAVVAGGWIFLRPLLHAVASARTPEVFAAAAVLAVLGTAWIVGLVGLPMPLGAFLAGLLLSESEFRHQIEADIQPFRGFLLGLFFMTVGMGIDFGLVGREGPTLLVAVVLLVAVKALLLFGLAGLFGVPGPDRLRIALLLAQGGEFAFVLFGLAGANGIIAGDERDMLLLVVAVSMVATPALASIGERGARRRRAAAAVAVPVAVARPVIIAGFGRVGQTIAAILSARDIPYVALDLDAERVAHARAKGLSVYFGDAGRGEVLRASGAADARLAVITLDEPDAAERAVRAFQAIRPDTAIFARVRDGAHGRILAGLGAVHVVPETLEASLQLGAQVLGSLGVATADIATIIGGYRDHDYARLTALEAPGTKV